MFRWPSLVELAVTNILFGFDDADLGAVGAVHIVRVSKWNGLEWRVMRCRADLHCNAYAAASLSRSERSLECKLQYATNLRCLDVDDA